MISTSGLEYSRITLDHDASTSRIETAIGPESTLTQGLDTLSNERAKRILLIERNPGICRGEPILRSTRISVANIVELHHLLGWSVEKIKEEYPYLQVDHVLAALEYYEERPREIDGYLQQEREAEGE